MLGGFFPLIFFFFLVAFFTHLHLPRPLADARSPLRLLPKLQIGMLAISGSAWLDAHMMGNHTRQG